jgi:DNA-binding NarL/FixJ family response regulator
VIVTWPLPARTPLVIPVPEGVNPEPPPPPPAMAPLKNPADRLREVAANIDGGLVRAMATHAEGLAHGDGAALDAAAAAFAELGCNHYAAAVAAGATSAHRAAGQRASAAASANRARVWIDQCEGVRTSALAWLDHEDGLTAREREVATLAARGLADQQIAKQLFVSLRTVHAHLRSAYTKLGVSGRSHLAMVLGTDSQKSE